MELLNTTVLKVQGISEKIGESEVTYLKKLLARDGEVKILFVQEDGCKFYQTCHDFLESIQEIDFWTSKFCEYYL